VLISVYERTRYVYGMHYSIHAHTRFSNLKSCSFNIVFVYERTRYVYAMYYSVHAHTRKATCGCYQAMLRLIMIVILLERLSRAGDGSGRETNTLTVTAYVGGYISNGLEKKRIINCELVNCQRHCG